MATARAKTKFVRLQPRKARLVADLIRGLQVADAEAQLMQCNMKAGGALKKTLASAIANAEMQIDARREFLHVMEVYVDEGPRLKRAKSKCRGGRTPVLKRTSHLTVIVGEVREGEGN
jgi:large subunit ribosomal protein L22